MAAKIIDGKVIKQRILDDLKSAISRDAAAGHGTPGLAVILVGDNPGSQAYVRMKKKACADIGIKSVAHDLPASTSQEELVALIQKLNQDPEIHGILLQLPLPKGLNAEPLLELISPAKDVDGFHPVNLGKLLSGLDCFRSCTPYGVCELMQAYDIDPEGKHVVIVGRSNIVGKPLAAMLMQKAPGANATVTVCHSRSNSRTRHIEDFTRQADILIAAIGQPEMIKAHMVKDHAIVIDVGINRVDDPGSPKGYKLVGDVDYNSVKERASMITPVPGGVGPMTIAMLMKNTYTAFLKSIGISEK